MELLARDAQRSVVLLLRRARQRDAELAKHQLHQSRAVEARPRVRAAEDVRDAEVAARHPYDSTGRARLRRLGGDALCGDGGRAFGLSNGLEWTDAAEQDERQRHRQQQRQAYGYRKTTEQSRQLVTAFVEQHAEIT